MSKTGVSKITISNGVKFIRIRESDLDKARAKGFYRPAERGRTLVTDGKNLQEIPLADLEKARSRGLRDALARERRSASDAILNSPAGPASDSSAPRSHDPPSLETPPPGVIRAMPVGAEESAQPRTDGAVAFSGVADLAAELSEAEQAAAEQRRAAEDEIDQATGFKRFVLWLKLWCSDRRSKVIASAQSHSISILVHVAAVLILASLFLTTEEDPAGVVLSASPTQPTELIQEVKLQTEAIEVAEPVEVTEVAVETPEIDVEPVDAVPQMDFAKAITGAAVAPPAAPAANTPAEAKMPTGKPTFFSTNAEAVDYCFVIDNSNSMTRGRFETAINELLKAVGNLSAKQNFYVIFYSDTAYPLFHPQPARGLVPATLQNRKRLYAWLKTVQLCLQTRGREAIQMALDLEPDVIYVLGDGAFTDRAGSFFSKKLTKKIPIHALGMEVNERKARSFKMLAEASGGTFRNVNVNPIGAQVAERFPRIRNSSRGPVWGLRLKIK